MASLCPRPGVRGGPRVLEADAPEGHVNGWRFPAGDCRVSMALAHHGGYWSKTVTKLEGDAVEELELKGFEPVPEVQRRLAPG